jgi:hypothetical protein
VADDEALTNGWSRHHVGEMRAKGMVMLEAACGRCDRPGRLQIERLIAEHGRASDLSKRS